MGLLTREDILAAGVELPVEDVEVPEWGGAVRVRGLTGAERDRFEESIFGDRAKGGGRKLRLANMRARLVALSVVDADGKRLFSSADVEALGRQSAAALDRVFSVAQRLSGMSDRDVEELTENFPDDPNDDSTLS